MNDISPWEYTFRNHPKRDYIVQRLEAGKPCPCFNAWLNQAEDCNDRAALAARRESAPDPSRWSLGAWLDIYPALPERGANATPHHP